MNIEQYRALKAQEEQEAAQKESEQSQSAEKVEKSNTEPNEKPPVKEDDNETKSLEETKIDAEEKIEGKEEDNEPALPEKINIEGIGEVTLDELKNGYLRQSDYTRKTQDVSRKSKEAEEAIAFMEYFKKNPELTKKLAQYNQLPQEFTQSVDPTQSKVTKLEQQLYDMKLEREIETLQGKYDDFEAREVLQTAKEKGIVNLEDAYWLTKKNKPTSQQPSIDADTLKKQLREEVLKEIEKERKETQTIISSNDTPPPIQDNTPKLSDAERKVASRMKMSEDEYVKWRDASKKR